MSKIKGKIRPLHDNIIIDEMEFGFEVSQLGVILPSDNGKGSGVHPRWGRVFAVGPEQKDVKVGDWILLEHGRWSRGFTYVRDNGEETELRLADKKAILMISDEKPTDTMRSATVGAGSNINFNIPGA